MQASPPTLLHNDHHVSEHLSQTVSGAQVRPPNKSFTESADVMRGGGEAATRSSTREFKEILDNADTQGSSDSGASHRAPTRLGSGMITTIVYGPPGILTTSID